MSGAAARIPRPKNLSHIQKNDLFKHIYISLGVGFTAGLAYWFGYAKRYERRYEEFMMSYDPYEDFERMRKLGLFQGAPPDDVIAEMVPKRKKAFQNVE